MRIFLIYDRYIEIGLIFFIFLGNNSIGDQFNNRSATKDMFLPGMTTRGLADQTNEYFQKAVKRDGKSYVSLLDGFIVALREEIDSPGGLATRNPAAIERQPYRLDVKSDGTGIESTGWFRSSDGNGKEADEAVMMSRICALEWVITLYEFVVPHSLKAEVRSLSCFLLFSHTALANNIYAVIMLHRMISMQKSSFHQ